MASSRAATAAFLLLATLGACAATRDDDLYGVVLDVESEQPFVRDEDFAQRLHGVLEASCAHVGVDTSRLYGLRLRIVDGPVPCGAVAAARGCTRLDGAEIVVSTLAWLSTSPPVPCVEDTPLPHEILHLRIGDPAHADPRWDDPDYWEPLQRRLEHADCSGEPATRIWKPGVDGPVGAMAAAK
jgi:hypothetical protein